MLYQDLHSYKIYFSYYVQEAVPKNEVNHTELHLVKNSGPLSSHYFILIIFRCFFPIYFCIIPGDILGSFLPLYIKIIR